MLRGVVMILILAVGAVAHANPGQPWIGVSIKDDEDAVLIAQVMPDTPAERAGLRQGDLVLAVDDTATPSTVALQRAIRSHRIGEEVTVHIIRGDEKRALEMLLEPQPEARDLAKKHLLGRKAPAFSLDVVSGKTKGSLASLEGDVVVVEFWATWCKACKATFDELAALQRDEKKRGLTVLGLSAEDRRTVAKFAADEKLGFAVLHDRDKAVQGEYLAQFLPTVVVIDRTGVVRYVAVGADELPGAIRVARRLARDLPVPLPVPE